MNITVKNAGVALLALLLAFTFSMQAQAGFLEDARKKAEAKLKKKASIPASTEVPSKPAAQNSGGSPVDQLAEKDISNATFIGNVAGIAGGAILGNKLCGNSKHCKNNKQINQLMVAAMMKLGSDVGSKFGKEIGEAAANRRKSYATEHDYLESEISASENAITVREEGIQSTNSEISSTRARIKELEAKESLTRSEISEAKKLRKSLEEQVETNNNLVVQYNEKIAYLDYALNTSEENAEAKKEDKAMWQKKHASLTEKRDALVKQRESVEQQNAQLTNDQQVLKKIIT